jgi:hypothetical protein
MKRFFLSTIKIGVPYEITPEESSVNPEYDLNPTNQKKYSGNNILD